MPSDLITAAFAAALLCAAAVWALALGSLGLKSLWLRVRKPAFAGELMHGPAQGYAFHIGRARWRVQASVASLFAGLAALGTALILTPPDLNLAAWQHIALVAISAIFLLLVALSGAFHGWRINRWQHQRVCRELVAQHIHRIGGERDRVFHDVATTDGAWIDHVLIGVQGAFAVIVAGERPGKDGIAERHGDSLMLDDDSFVDLDEARQRSNRLQHQLSKSLGRMIKLRTVVALPGWRIRNNTADDMLIVGHRDIVMIKGWRKASDGLMNEDAEALQKQLETLTRSSFRPSLGALDAHNPVIRPERARKAPSGNNKATATA